MLLLLLDFESEDAIPDLSSLTNDQLDEIQQWAANMHCEASDNDVHASAAPQCLRDLLPKDHYYQTWRISREKQA